MGIQQVMRNKHKCYDFKFEKMVDGKVQWVYGINRAHWPEINILESADWIYTYTKIPWMNLT